MIVKHVSELWSFLRLVYMGAFLQVGMRDETAVRLSARETAAHGYEKSKVLNRKLVIYA